MEKRVFLVLVQNRFGVLAKVSSIFGRRGCNIHALTVYEEEPGLSRMTITFTCGAETTRQISNQLKKLEDVREVALLEARISGD
ncbi:MAG: acetolactate synthase small subunit [Oscillospiraceae bacterium]|jgi:acetolactate synthase-1/3 small subunit|nr:acetolactate synthase small subunit [Oscillospiraceae bacterium]